MKTLAIFDFDHTILNVDSTGEFIRYAFSQSSKRRLALGLAMPLFKLLSVSKRTEWRRNWLYYQFAVGGKKDHKMQSLQTDFYRFLFGQRQAGFYQQAVEQIRFHQRSGHDLIIISGALNWLLEALCERLEIGDATLLGSHKQWFCYGPNKVISLQQQLNLQDYQEIHGYSDSAADIPMLALCTHRTIVNPKPACQQKFEQAFGQKLTLVNWQELDS